MKESNTERMRTIVENVILAITAIVSIAISVLDLIGLPDKVDWIAERIPTLALLGIGFGAGYLILERRGKIDKIAENIQQQKVDLSNLVTTSFNETIRKIKRCAC